MVGGLAALAALLVSPVQVYCVGVVLDAMQFDLALSRMRISAIYAASLLSAAPFLLFKEKAAEVVSRQVLVGLCGVLFCGGCVLLTMVQGPTALLAVWTLMQVVGPGVLYPATESALVQWWRRRRAMVGAAVQSSGALLGMLVLPAILSAVACSPDGDAWCASGRAQWPALPRATMCCGARTSPPSRGRQRGNQLAPAAAGPALSSHQLIRSAQYAASVAPPAAAPSPHTSRTHSCATM